ncbi:hypothetical protein MN116_004476 [Schistosoma mekongi]|uniref:Sphingosine phosphate lyase n=1 Tax=Schistosoma mekongi TaxID=38744 RepID=A0AAE1ZGA9_SCHME|nr:hypothetical protein MN116_004476 [Schistosoma mekongi]
MSLPRSQALTLKEFLSLHPSDTSTISTQSTLYNDKQIEQSLNNQQTHLWSQNILQSINQSLLPHIEPIPSTSIHQSQNISTFMNINTSNKQSFNKETIYPISQVTTNSLIKPITSNYTNRQQLKRSNTVGITDVTKTMQRKLLMNYVINKVNNHNYIDELFNTSKQYNQLSTNITNLINSSNDTTYNEFSNINHKQRLFSRAQILSQRGLNLGKSIWQKNFTSDQHELKTTLGSSDNSQMPTTSYLSQRNRLRKEFTVDDALLMDIKGLHSVKNNSSINSICSSSSSGNNNSHYINGPLFQSSITSQLPSSGLSLATSMTATITTTTSKTISSTGLSSDQSISKEIWNRKYVEEILKKSLSTSSTNKLLNIHNEPVHLSSSFSGQTLVQWFCRQIIQSGYSWSHGLISVVCQLCNCLLRLGVLKRDPKSKVINSMTTDERIFGHYGSDSNENSSSTALSTETFELSMNYVWSGFNECKNTVTNTLMNENSEQLQLSQKQQQQQQQPIDESNQFQMAINNHLINLHKKFEYELDRVTREHELQLFKVKNQGVMKVCQLTDRIEALENQVEKYRILAGIEHLTKSSILDETSPINNNLLRNHYSPLVTNKNRISKVTFNLPNETLLNHFSRRIRASSETTHVNHMIDNIYNKPDYIKSMNVDNLQPSTSSHHYNYHEQQQQHQQNHQQEQQQQQQQEQLHQNYQEEQQQQQPQHTRSDSINLRRTYEMSHLKNLLQKSNSLKIHQKENSTKQNRTDLSFLSFDNDTVNESSNNGSLVNNVNKVNNNSSMQQQQYEDSMTRSLKNDENNPVYQKTYSQYSTSRFISASPQSKLNLWQTTSTSNVQSNLGIQAKYDINNKLTTTVGTTLKTSMREDDNSMTMKDIKRIDKDKRLT